MGRVCLASDSICGLPVFSVLQVRCHIRYFLISTGFHFSVSCAEYFSVPEVLVASSLHFEHRNVYFENLLSVLFFSI